LVPDTGVLLLDETGTGVDAVLAQGSLGDLHESLSTFSVGSDGDAEDGVEGKVHA
jgi:hypothetical protein